MLTSDPTRPNNIPPVIWNKINYIKNIPKQTPSSPPSDSKPSSSEKSGQQEQNPFHPPSLPTSPNKVPPGHIVDVVTGTVIQNPQYTEQEKAELRLRGEYASMSPIAQFFRFTSISVLSTFRPETIYAKVTGGELAGIRETLKWEASLPKDNFQKFIDIQKPAYENVILPLAGGYVLGASTAVVTKAAPAAGKILQTGMAGYGAYSTAQSTIPPAIQGMQTGNWKPLGTNIMKLGVQLPFIAAGYTAGWNKIKDINIPTITTRGTQTLDKINTNAVVPIKTLINKMNPINIWVGARATERTDIISPRVQSGEEIFPTSPNVRKTLEYFQKGYNKDTGLIETVHARAYPMKEDIIPASTPTRKTDVLGLYVSAKGEGSPYFLRVGSTKLNYEYGPAEMSFLPKKPTFRLMNVEEVTRAPRNVRYSVEGFKEWQMNTEPGSRAFITPAHELGKGEIEAVINPGARLRNMIEPKGLIQRIKGYDTYTTYMGKRIPVYDYRVLPGEGKIGVPMSSLDKFTKNTDLYLSNYKPFYSISRISSFFGVGSYQNNISKGTSSVKYTQPKYSPSYSGGKGSSTITSPRYTQPRYTPPSTPRYTPPTSPPKYTPPTYTPPVKSPPKYTPPVSPPRYTPPTSPPKYTPPLSPPKYAPPYYPPVKKKPEGIYPGGGGRMNFMTRYKFREFKIGELIKI